MSQENKIVEITPADFYRLSYLLAGLRDCCEEGLDGTWDTSTSEGRESFEDMSDLCQLIAGILKIELPPYKSKRSTQELA